MPAPRRRHAEPLAPAPYGSIETAVWAQESEERGSACQCPQRTYGGCVDDLGLPPRFGPYVHPDGRRGTFILRTRRRDPVTFAVVRTAVTFERVDTDGGRVTWSLQCAGPAPTPNRPGS